MLPWVEDDAPMGGRKGSHGPLVLLQAPTMSVFFNDDHGRRRSDAGVHQGGGEREVMRDAEPDEGRCAGDDTTGSPASAVAPTVVRWSF